MKKKGEEGERGGLRQKDSRTGGREREKRE